MSFYQSLIDREEVGKKYVVDDYARKFGPSRKKSLSKVELNIFKNKIEVNNRHSALNLTNTIRNETEKKSFTVYCFKIMFIENFYSRSAEKKLLLREKKHKG
ncbi:hypothetical protein CDIK_0025 [Cucumispora dikerogammari]|nr:hypothetical protein CDIK_0025 [Cucumispora dikerogammari]